MKITRKQLRKIISEAAHGGTSIGFEGWEPNKRPDFAKSYGRDARVVRDFGSNSARASRIRECGDDMHVSDMQADSAPVSVEPAQAAPVVESLAPEQEVIVEMEVAQRSLEQVVESVQAAAALCPGCGDGVAAQAPLVESLAKQAEALLETLDAQIALVTESVGTEEDVAVVDLTGMV
tara:strand:+ start:161 stop:694 length:534 start_codon:yes stop_codon:yes gene_type:complete